jgi:5-methylcytosine-specific restriction endonuclease McrA
MRRFRGFDRAGRAAIVRALLDRDGATCGLCETALDLSAPLDHGTTTTIDHVVPISEGGEVGDELRIGNLRLTHSRCNGLRVKHEGFAAAWFARELERFKS